MRSFAPTTAGPNHERALEWLDELESHDSIVSVSVRVWGAAFERTAHRRRVPELERIERTLAAFERWAARTGRDLEPFFRTRRVDATFTDDSFVVCRLPTLALAEYRGDDLVHVAPSYDGDRPIDVLDRLEALDRGDAVEPVLAYDGSRSGESDRGSTDDDERRWLESSL